MWLHLILLACFLIESVTAFFTASRPLRPLHVPSQQVQKPILPLPIQSQRLRPWQAQTNDSENEFESDGWKAGNVEQDFHLLRMEVARLNAPFHLAQQERLDLLDDLARERMEIIPQLIKFLRPIIISMLMCTLLSWRRLGGETLRRWGRVLVSQAASVQFWLVTVCAPLSVYIPRGWSRYQKERNREMTEEEKELALYDPEYIPPNKDCSDYIFCLAENWLSCVAPSLLLGGVYLLSRWKLLRAALNSSVGAGSNIVVSRQLLRFGTATFQLISRLGSIAAVHQYPKLLYQLRRTNQPRPLQFYPFFLDQLLKILFRSTPYALGYGLVQLFASGGDIFRSSVGLWNKSTAVFGLMLGGLMLPSLIHLIALVKNIQIQYFTDVSLNSDTETFEKGLNDKTRYKWRYKLDWREPKRVSDVIQTMRRDFIQWYFGDWDVAANNGLQVDDKGYGLPLWNKGGEDLEEEPMILRLVGEEMERTPNKPKPDRTTWIPYAVKRKAQKHQADYESKTFEDPLGVAVQQTMGIGLSFDYDHSSPLKKGEEPSVHRLRARAAKSAIKRLNEIPDEIERKVRNIESLEAQVKEGIRLTEVSNEKELRYFAKELLNSIAVDGPDPEGKDLELDTLSQSDAKSIFPDTERTMIPSQEKRDPWKEAIRREYGDEYVDDPYLNAEDIFVHEFMKKYRNLDSKSAEEDADNNDFGGETFLA